MKNRKLIQGIAWTTSMLLMSSTILAEINTTPVVSYENSEVVDTTDEIEAEEDYVVEDETEIIEGNTESIEDGSEITEDNTENIEEDFVEIVVPGDETIVEVVKEEVVLEVMKEEPIIEEVYIGDDASNARLAAVIGDTAVQQEIMDALYNTISNVQNKEYLNDHDIDFEEMKSYIILAISESKNINRNLLGNKLSISKYPVSKKYKFTPDEGAVGEIWYYQEDNRLEIVYNDAETIRRTTAEFDAVVDEILEVCSVGKTEVDKELLLHDYLVANYAYDYERLENGTMPNESYSAYGLLVNKTAVCQGYAYAMKHILRKMDIPCDVVTGGGHAWNIVCIDGEYYYVDATWNDPVPDKAGNINRDHFNVTDEQLAASGHTWDVSNYPACTSEKYSFLQNSNEYIHSDDLWFYTTKKMESIDGQYYGENTLFMYNIATEQKYLIDTEACSNLEYDEEEQKLYFEKSGEIYYYDILAEAMEEVSGFVGGFYKAFLGRTASNEEIESWSKAIVKGDYTGAQLAEVFCNSTEFINKKLSNEQYVETLYKGILGRIEDASGVAYWSEKLERGLSRTYVLAEFIKSDEFTNLCNQYGIQKGSIKLTNAADIYASITPFVYRFYQLGLGRTPDQGGLNYWVENLHNGQFTGAHMAQSFLLCDEFINQGLADDNFVEILYTIFFDRASDASGKQYWLSSMEKGKDRVSVIKDFIHSKEYKGICSQYNIKHS